MTPTLIGIDLACPGEDYSVQVTIAKSGEWRCRRIEKPPQEISAKVKEILSSQPLPLIKLIPSPPKENS